MEKKMTREERIALEEKKETIWFAVGISVGTFLLGFCPVFMKMLINML